MRRFLTIATALLLVMTFSLAPRGPVSIPAALAANPSPPFTECPAIAADTSCALLIYIDNTGGVVLQDGSQGPFDRVEDTLIGVRNNSTVTINSIPISGPGIFGLDRDGLCSGIDGNGDPYTPPAGCSFGTTGYEGPNTVLTSIDANNGVVTFPSGLAAGASAYFSLEGTINAADITLPTTTLAYTGDTTKDYNDVATLSATLLDRTNNPISGQTVNFSAGSQSCSGTTDGSGSASCQITVNQSPGTYAISANFPGTSNYIPSSASSTLTVTQEETTLTYTGVTTSDYNDAATVSAVLTDAVNAAEGEGAATPVSGESVTFLLNGTDTCTASTDSTGSTSCSITPSEKAGPYTVTAVTTGDTNYAGSNTSSPFQVTLEEDTLTSSTSLHVLPSGHADQLSSVLKEDGTTAISGRSVKMTLGSGTSAVSCSATTDATGTASCNVTPTSAILGPQPISDSFTSDGFYQSATNAETAMVFAFLGSGSFVLGDKTVASATSTTQVNWWGSQWWKMNSVTTEPNTGSFKGFANATNPAPPACGGTWTTTTGNSPPPPAPSTVPSYMGVVVTSSLMQVGSNYAGNVSKIVVVHTLPGYQPDPSHPGTGTVVATYCP